MAMRSMPLYLLIFTAIVVVRSENNFPDTIYAQYNNTIYDNVSRGNDPKTYTFNWTSQAGIFPFRIFVQSSQAELNHSWPLIVVARQGSSVMTTMLPFTFIEHTEINAYGGSEVSWIYHSLARTICPDATADDSESDAVVTVSTSRRTPINFSLRGSLVETYTLSVKSPMQVVVQPSMPQYFWFNFSDSAGSSAAVGANSVRVLVNSTENANACLIMSIQSAGCPVWDQPETVDHNGLHEMVLTKGDIYVSRADFPHGFFIVLLSYPSDRPCQGPGGSSRVHRGFVELYSTKVVTVEVVWAPEVKVSTLIGVLVFWCLIVLVSLFAALFTFRQRRAEGFGEGFGLIEDNEEGPANTSMSVAVLSRKPVSKSVFAVQLVVIAAFYSLPVIQMMLLLINNIYSNGDLDSCYYNYACGMKQTIGSSLEIYAFNSVFSNIGYLAVGVAFMAVTFVKQYYIGDCKTGVPDSFGLYYACGAAVAMEGIMSAAYHLCPSQHNFQFDTAFMLMIAGLLIVLLYSKRHPDLTPAACIAYLAIGAFILANTLGILLTKYRVVAFSILVVLHIILTVWIAFQVYSCGHLRDLCHSGAGHFPYPPDKDYQTSVFARCGCCQPMFPSTLMFLAVAVALNIAAAGFCIACAIGTRHMSISNCILAIFIMNFLLYLLYYLLRKVFMVRRTECRCIILNVCLLVAVTILVICALYYYSKAPTEWTLSPAKSRDFNSPCVLFNEFDVHDLWHFLSAAGLYAMLLLILCVDINDDGKRRADLPVF